MVELYRLLVAKNAVRYSKRAVERAQANLKMHGKVDDMTDLVVVHLHPFDSRDECVKSKRYAALVVSPAMFRHSSRRRSSRPSSGGCAPHLSRV